MRQRLSSILPIVIVGVITDLLMHLLLCIEIMGMLISSRRCLDRWIVRGHRTSATLPILQHPSEMGKTACRRKHKPTDAHLWATSKPPELESECRNRANAMQSQRLPAHLSSRHNESQQPQSTGQQAPSCDRSRKAFVENSLENKVREFSGSLLSWSWDERSAKASGLLWRHNEVAQFNWRMHSGEFRTIALVRLSAKARHAHAHMTPAQPIKLSRLPL